MIAETINNLLQDHNLSGDSKNWANWQSLLTPFTCSFCRDNHGKIVSIKILNENPAVEAHINCRCRYVAMRTKKAGTATLLGTSGADMYLHFFNRLPNYYVKKSEAKRVGWKNYLGNLDEVLPGKMIGGDTYANREEKLPSAPGRIWYEADINYKGGYRNRERVLFSNDGLVFVSYDHYQTFYEITT